MCTKNYWPDINQSLYTNALEKMVQKSCEVFLQQILGWKMNVSNIRDYSLKSKQTSYGDFKSIWFSYKFCGPCLP